jgi:ankyrin repeat protein
MHSSLHDVKLQTQSGGDPNRFCDPSENMMEPNALQYACFKGHAKVAEKLVELGAQVNLANKKGYTALHYAALMGHLETCQSLVQLGADLNATDMFGDRPIDRAGQARCGPVYDWLKDAMLEEGLQVQEDDTLLNEVSSAKSEIRNTIVCVCVYVCVLV